MRVKGGRKGLKVSLSLSPRDSRVGGPGTISWSNMHGPGQACHGSAVTVQNPIFPPFFKKKRKKRLVLYIL